MHLTLHWIGGDNVLKVRDSGRGLGLGVWCEYLSLIAGGAAGFGLKSRLLIKSNKTAAIPDLILLGPLCTVDKRSLLYRYFMQSRARGVCSARRRFAPHSSFLVSSS